LSSEAQVFLSGVGKLLLTNNHMHYVYLLKLSNDDFYSGSTNNLKMRIRKHKFGQVTHTSKFRPFQLRWFAGFTNKEKALKFEKYLKSSSGKAFRNKHLI